MAITRVVTNQCASLVKDKIRSHVILTETRKSRENNHHLVSSIYFHWRRGEVSTSEDMASTNNDGEQNKRLFEGVQFYVEISKGLNKEEAGTVSRAT